MTGLLEKALAQLSELPEQEQDAIAAWLLEELASERRWERLLADSPGALERLADEAQTEHRTGLSQELDPNGL